MMKRATSLLLFLFVVLAPMTPVAAFQPIVLTPVIQDIKSTTPTVKLNMPLKAVNTDAFCAGFSETKSKLETALAEKNDRVKDYLGGIVENLNDRRGNRDAKRDGLRSEADQKRSAWYERLEARAKTETEKDAVLKYRERVEKAVDNRREDIDAAVKSYRESIDTLVTKRQTAMDAARNLFQTATLAAIDTAEKDCANGVATITVTKNFKTALAAARTKLASDKKNAAVMEDQIRDLAEVRKKTVVNVLKQYRTDLEMARVELRTSFGR